MDAGIWEHLEVLSGLHTSKQTADNSVQPALAATTACSILFVGSHRGLETQLLGDSTPRNEGNKMSRFSICISMVLCLFSASSAHAAKLYGNDFGAIYEIAP